MIEEVVKYEILNPPTLELDKKGKPWRYIYQVSNNIELPDYKAAQSPYYASTSTENIGSEAIAKARELGIFNELGGLNDVNIIGNEPQELKDKIFEYQMNQILKGFDKGKPPIRIPGKSYQGQKYPYQNIPLDEYFQDPIEYSFGKGVVIRDNVTLGPLKGVQIKDLDGVKVKSNTEGTFAITGSAGGKGRPQELILNKKGYSPTTKIITNNKGATKSSINILYMTPNEKDIQSSVLKSQGTSQEEADKITTEETIDAAKEIAEKGIEEVKIRLVPFIIKKLLCQPYGVCDPIGLIEKAKQLAEQAKARNEERKEKKAEREAEKAVKEAEEGLQQ